MHQMSQLDEKLQEDEVIEVDNKPEMYSIADLISRGSCFLKGKIFEKDTGQVS